ncbi:MAG: rhodanese-like domain-containing protein [Thermodesulfobacteriota bacterium]
MKPSFALCLALVAPLLLLPGCGDPPPSQTSQAGSATGQQETVFRSLSPQEAKALMGTNKELLLIDVRGPDELWLGSIPGSQLIPFTEIAKGKASLPPGRPLLLICAVGGRSYAVGRYFASRGGYPEIYNLDGGIAAWKAAGLPLARP